MTGEWGGPKRELRGNLHIHTTCSDGSRTLEEIAGLAQGYGLDFIGLNDHFAPSRPSRYQGGVLLLLGSELNREHSHYLVYGPAPAFGPGQHEGAKVAAGVKARGGMGIIAHPFEKGSPLVGKGKHYPWRDWNSEDFQGIEIWNLTSQWRDSARSLGQSLGQWLLAPYRPFKQGACPQALARWDELSQKRHVTGIAGSDLHGPLVRALGCRFRILDYPMLLPALNTYCRAAVTGEGEEDGARVIEALIRGRCWIAQDRLCLGRGFFFWAETERARRGMGEKIPRVGGKAWLRIVLPRRGEIRLIHNGALLSRLEGRRWDLAVTEAGPYRVEVRLRDVPWLYSNPLYLE